MRSRLQRQRQQRGLVSHCAVLLILDWDYGVIPQFLESQYKTTWLDSVNLQVLDLLRIHHLQQPPSLLLSRDWFGLISCNYWVHLRILHSMVMHLLRSVLSHFVQLLALELVPVFTSVTAVLNCSLLIVFEHIMPGSHFWHHSQTLSIKVFTCCDFRSFELSTCLFTNFFC